MTMTVQQARSHALESRPKQRLKQRGLCCSYAALQRPRRAHRGITAAKVAYDVEAVQAAAGSATLLPAAGCLHCIQHKAGGVARKPSGSQSALHLPLPLHGISAYCCRYSHENLATCHMRLHVTLPVPLFVRRGSSPLRHAGNDLTGC